MKRFLSTSMLLIVLLLAACAPGADSGKCSKGVCVKIRSSSSIKVNASITMTINVKVDRDMPDFDVTMMIYPGGAIEDPVDKTDVTWKDKGGITWKKNLQAGKEVIITQNVRVEQPGDYTVMAAVMALAGPIDVRDGVVLRVTGDGGTEFLFDTPIPTVTPGPPPTVTSGAPLTFPPTETSGLSPTVDRLMPTIPAYPAPTGMNPTEKTTEVSSPVPTLPAYP